MQICLAAALAEAPLGGWRASPEAIARQSAEEVEEEDFAWPPVTSVGARPSELARLADLMQDKADIWDFVATEVVGRLVKSKRPGSPSGRRHAGRSRHGRAVPRLRSALGCEAPVPPGPVQREPGALGAAAQGTPLGAQEVRLVGLPDAWNSEFLWDLLKQAGLCPKCDVATVRMDQEGTVRVRLNSEAAAAKCLRLDGTPVLHGALVRPLWVQGAGPSHTRAQALLAPAHHGFCSTAAVRAPPGLGSGAEEEAETDAEEEEELARALLLAELATPQAEVPATRKKEFALKEPFAASKDEPLDEERLLLALLA